MAGLTVATFAGIQELGIARPSVANSAGGLERQLSNELFFVYVQQATINDLASRVSDCGEPNKTTADISMNQSNEG